MASINEPMNGDGNTPIINPQVYLGDELAALPHASSPGELTGKVLLLHSKECSSCQADKQECIGTTSVDDVSCICCGEKGQPCVVDNDEDFRFSHTVQKIHNIYKYTRLQPDEDIRLVVVQPGYSEDAVKCNIVPSSFPSKQASSLRKCYNYQALSYTWGIEIPNVALSIVSLHHPPGERDSLSHIVSSTIYIRPHLYNALRSLRRPDQDVALWVDVLCNNQNDTEEKDLQVSKLVEIFAHATSTCIWLGLDTGTYRAKATFNFLKRLSDLREIDQILTDNSQDNAQNCLAVIDLLEIPWFSRLWIIQDIALSKRAILHYGNSSMLWNDFADAVAIFMLKDREVKQIVMTVTHATVDLHLSAIRLIDAASKLFRISNDGQKIERLASLEYLVCDLFCSFKGSDPRDRIYAVLSMAKDVSSSFEKDSLEESSSQKLDQRVIPDYTATAIQTFSRFVNFCVEKSKSLDIICRSWAPIMKRHLGQTDCQAVLPSWIPSLAGSPFGGSETALGGRVNGDSFVGGVLRRNYNATGSLQPASVLKGPISDFTENEISLQRDLIRQDPPLLCVSGFLLGKIKRLSPQGTQGIVFAKGLELCGWPNSDERVPDELWRTLVADKGPDGTYPPSWYRRTCAECLKYLSPSGDLNTQNLLLSSSVPSIIKMYLERVQAVIWNRKVFRAESGGILRDRELLGLGPSTTQENDLVCILFGCSVPVILRAQELDHFTLVGEAYVHGMMDGEALSLVGHGWKHPYPNAQVFKIV